MLNQERRDTHTKEQFHKMHSRVDDVENKIHDGNSLKEQLLKKVDDLDTKMTSGFENLRSILIVAKQPEAVVVPQDKNAIPVSKVNYLSFDPFNEWVLATASSDSTVGLFDIRKLTMPLYVLSSHTEEVFQVECDPNHETVSASSADDRRLMVWDLTRIGEEQREGDADDGPPELLLSDGDHKAKISDISWNKNEPLVISSLAGDKTIHVWQMAENVWRHDDDTSCQWMCRFCP